ncbi:MAG: T9SS type A sorting domain-containing protein [Ignavibacteria bacterium]|nr:T9SS type A sorting domain-containing protein [Ignavibacteria bacterium]
MKKLIVTILLLPISILSQWTQISTINSPELKAVKFFNEHTGIVAGQGGIWRSTNSGVNWTQVLSGHTLYSVSFPDISIGYAVGDSGIIFKTTNAGLNWNQIGIGVTSKRLNTVSFPSVNTGWIMGESGKILYTFNGGTSFTNQSNGDTTYEVNYLHMANGTTGYYCGSSSANAETFGVTGNGGINWLYTFFMAGNILNATSNIPGLGGYALAVGTNGRIRRTTTNGTTWTVITSPVSVQLNHIVFLDANTGYIAGNSGNILKTTNSGLNWVIDATVTANNLKCISFINANTAWAVGSNGVVIRMGIPVGINSNSNIQTYTLEQNFPNPFNPQTKIVVEIPARGLIKLVVYDVIGNEIITIVNNEVNAGIYEYNFDGGKYSSGVYAYRLFINNQFIDSKKMTLIK